MSFLRIFGVYSAQEYAQLQDQYAKSIEEKRSCNTELYKLKANNISHDRENANLIHNIEILRKENLQLSNTIKELTNNFNIKRIREQSVIEKALQIELDLKKEENYNLNMELRDAKSIIDHITGMDGANFYSNDMIKFIRTKQQQETPGHD
ncbi:MAG: hypothetical protein MPEBLZ_02053 [Candidatus Methanoperedens nitroreducens]|uniref:Uncharacterized protein n=1 Tax=Candidatus Methanoperedens nitratireducens TaxID=1392998 RepID=A0A0P8C9C5_9EURY|nr:MAG: hypothetical protein MPEBLZ_02053 [Candidatus Methanoperedens sp. BLZ1]